jgi:hypothetical protein
MENLVKSRTVEQAIEWLEKMNIEVEHTGPTNMYEFEYKGDIMLINADAPEGVLFITSPIYIPSESEQEGRTLFTKALDITEDDLSDYVVEFVKNNLAYIAKPMRCLKSQISCENIILLQCLMIWQQRPITSVRQ